ncbi:DMT family transporter [Magnetovibrio sp. PR-2]|uniref:DMT family transporter n=1 Tax=Magnetovibrio sp. PR-2 TaxID=3120356 RepID=UPI002FCDE98D
MTSPAHPSDTLVSPAIAILMIITTGVVLAGMDVTAKYLALGAPILMVIWGRYFFHTVITFVVLAGRQRSFGFLKAKRPGLQFVRALCLFGATGFMYVAITQMPLGDAAAIQFMAPVLVTVISGLFLGEHVGPRRMGAVAVAFVGVLFVARPGTDAFAWVAVLPFITAILLGVYMVLTRVIRTKDRSDATTFYSTAVGALCLSLAVPFVWQDLGTFEWLLMLAMGAAGALGHYLLVQAFHSAEASMLAPFTYSQVVAAIVWGFVVFGDVPSLWTAIGSALIIGSGVYVWYRETYGAKSKA